MSTQNHPVLLPIPRRFEWIDGSVDLSDAEQRIALDAVAMPHPQGYRITADDAGLSVVAHDDAGLYYAKTTLGQLMDAGLNPQTVTQRFVIEDWPDFPTRGVMLDISRDRVPSLESLCDLVKRLAGWKINHLQLYTEHTFAYAGHEQVWRHASPITPADLVTLRRVCAAHHVELAANQNSFGHMHRWLIHEPYKAIAECDGPWQSPWGQTRREPFSLCPIDPKSAPFVAGLFDQLLPHFDSPLVNVGCDETWDVGQGRSKQACEQRGRGQVYLDFLLEIHRLVTERGRTMQFWGDIILDYPDLISALPRDIIALCWGYEATHPFDAEGAKFAAAGVPFWVCPGTSTWNSIGGRDANARANLLNAAINGAKHGATGFLNTDWGDNGHWQPPVVSLTPYAYGAAVSWCPEANADVRASQVVARQLFGSAGDALADAIDNIANAYLPCHTKQSNQSPLWQVAHLAFGGDAPDPIANLAVDALQRSGAMLDAALNTLDETTVAPTQHHRIDELRWAATMLRYLVDHALLRKENGDKPFGLAPDQERKAMHDRLRNLIGQYDMIWQRTSRPGGFTDSVNRLHAMFG